MFCFFSGMVPVYAQSDVRLGSIAKINPVTKEILISSPRAAEKFKLGDRIYVQSGTDRIVMRVTFPMMTVAKCVIDPSHRGKFAMLQTGQAVFGYKGDEKFTIKYFETYDSAYLKKENKVRFIKEIPASELKSRNYYFEVTYDDKEYIVRTVEMKKHVKSVADYYKNDRIIKKETYAVGGKRIIRIQVNDYHPNGVLKETGDYDVENHASKVYRYDEDGKFIKDDSADSEKADLQK